MGSVIPLSQPRSKCRQWRLQVSLGRDKLTGKYPKATRRFEGTERQAKRALYEFEKEVEAGGVAMQSKSPFSSFSKAWLEERALYARNGTIRKNRVQVRSLNIWMGDVRMCDIDAEVVRHVMDMLSTKGGISGKPLSGTTCQGVFATLGLILENAKRKKLIASNPCRELETRHRPKCDTGEKDALSLEEARSLQALLMEGRPDSHKIGLMLALNCGLSREEFTALRWRDADLESRCLRVQSANTSDDDELVGTKNKYRKRIVPFDEAVASRLSEWRNTQEAELSAKGIALTRTTPIVSNPVGELMHPEAFGKWWRRFRKGIGLDNYGLHQLRHTYATILCASGVDLITASKLMGHCDTSMLSRVYAHVIPEYARSAADKVGSVLGGNEEIAPLPFTTG